MRAGRYGSVWTFAKEGSSFVVRVVDCDILELGPVDEQKELLLL